MVPPPRALASSRLGLATVALIVVGPLAAGCGSAEPEGPAPVALALGPATLPEVMLGAPYAERLVGSGGVPPYRYAIVEGALPEGLSLDGSGGQISGLAGSPGRAAFTAELGDAAGGSVRAALSIYVVPRPLQAVTRSLPDGQEGRPYAAELEARGGVPPYAWRLASGALPGGLALDGARLAGTPTSFGAFRFALEVSDAEARTDTTTLGLSLASLDPMIVTSTLPRARFDRPYEVRFEASGGRPPFDWSLAMGALPDGLGLSADGQLVGTARAAGRFPFSVRVEDADARADVAGFTLEVIPPLLIVTTAIPQAIRGRPYRFQLEASGGEPPYQWAVRSGNLPAGLSLDADGVLSGTTQDPASAEVSIRVRDAAGDQRLALFTVASNDRFVYRVEPALDFPLVCTSTHVSYAVAPIEVPDSMQIEELELEVDVDYTDSAPPRGQPQNTRLKLVLFAPDGTQVPLCGNGAGIRGWRGCPGAGGLHGVYGGTLSSDRPLETFVGLNPRGTWRFAAVVTDPSSGGGGCRQSGTIHSLSLSIRDDRSPLPYVRVTGFHRNNLSIEPWVRIAGGGFADQQRLALLGTIWEVGPNGLREGGAGDDVPRPVAMQWRFAGPSEVATVSADGRVEAGRRTGEGALEAEGDGMMWQGNLRVFPPDWDPRSREY